MSTTNARSFDPGSTLPRLGHSASLGIARHLAGFRPRGKAHGAPRVCALISGGLDSAVLLQQLLRTGKRVTPLYLRCGLRWEAAEIYWLGRLLPAMRTPHLEPLTVIDLPLRSLYENHWSVTARPAPSARSADAAVYLPGRNVLLLSVAAIHCAKEGISRIALGLLRSNPFSDASPRFLTQMARALSLALAHPIHILVPLAHVRKAQVIRAAREVPVALTFSCLAPRGRHHCGACNKCAERTRAFRVAGRADPTRYAA